MFVVNVKNKGKYSLACNNCVMIIHHGSRCFIAEVRKLVIIRFASWRRGQRHRYRRRRSRVRLPGRSSRALSPMRFLYCPGDNPRKWVPSLVALFSVRKNCECNEDLIFFICNLVCLKYMQLIRRPQHFASSTCVISKKNALLFSDDCSSTDVVVVVPLLRTSLSVIFSW